MSDKKKWLGAGLGWWLTGSPLGALIGYALGEDKTTHSQAKPRSEAANVLMLAITIAQADAVVNKTEEAFLRSYFRRVYLENFKAAGKDYLTLFLQHQYDCISACMQLRTYCDIAQRITISKFLFALATCDGPLTIAEERELFKLAGWLNINDVLYRQIKNEQPISTFEEYQLLNVSAGCTNEELKAAYRNAVRQYHPDKNRQATTHEQATLEEKFKRIQAAWEKIKTERGL